MKIILLDCFNVGHIAFHSMGELDYHGRKTGVVFGFMRRVLELAKRFETNQFVFCWDSQRSLRRMMYPDYKKKRGTTNDHTTGEIIDYMALHDQMADLGKYTLYKLGFNNVLLYAGLEADDVIALVVKQAHIDPAWRPNGTPEFVIASTDRDLYQLLASNTMMYNLRTKQTFTKDGFVEYYGITPDQWADAKAIGGCDTDSVAGIDGIADPAKSEKSRAIKYLQGTLTGKYKDLIDSELGQYIYKRNLPLVKLPVTTKVVPVIKADFLRRDAFIEVFDELGFASFLKQDKFSEWEAYLGLK